MLSLAGIETVELARPWALALLPAPLLARRLLAMRPPRAALRVPDWAADRLAVLSGDGAGGARRPDLGDVLRGLGWLALVAALAGPVGRLPTLTEASGRDLLLAVDLSASMAEADMAAPAPAPAPDGARPVAPRARIDVVREVAGAFLEGREGDRVGLIGFATDAYLLVPPTYDGAAAAAVLEEASIGLPGRRTDLGQALGLAVRALRRGSEGGGRTLIVLTDGETNAGELAARDAARLAAAEELVVHLIGFGAEIAPAAAEHMAEVAEETGGRAFVARDPSELAVALAEIGAGVGDPTSDTGSGAARRRDLSGPLLGAAFAFGLGAAWRERRG